MMMMIVCYHHYISVKVVFKLFNESIVVNYFYDKMIDNNLLSLLY